MHDRIPGVLRQDDDVFFALNGNYRATQFLDLPPPDHLKSNKDAMLKAVEKNPMCLIHVGDGLVGDFDLFAAALSGKDGILALSR